MLSTITFLFHIIFIFSLLPFHVVGFESSWSKRPFLSVALRTRNPNTLLGVAIYSWDDDVPSFVDDEPTVAPVPPYRSSVKDCLTREHVAELARLATAFSPPDRALNLYNIEHVQVMDVDDHHIEIEAVVRQDAGVVVALSVPVDFPHRCLDADEFTDCVLHQVEELDHLAEDRLQALEWEAAHHEEDERKWMELLGKTENSKLADLPSWWVYPTLLQDMAEECESVRRLLNEQGFQEELRALAATTLLIEHPFGRDLLVEQAAVAAVGPAGIYMRARAKLLRTHEESDETLLLDVPMRFDEEANSVAALREILLSAIELV